MVKQHGNVSETHNFRRSKTGHWQRQLRSGGRWRTLHVEYTESQVKVSKAGGTWKTEVSNIWTWR